MDRSGFKVSKYIKNVGLCGTVIVMLLFLSSSCAQGLEVTTEDGRDEYEQGEIIIFRIAGLNNSTVYLNFRHVNTHEVGNNTTYIPLWYGLNPIQLNESGNATLIHKLDYRTEFGNQEATYGYWDFELFESVNETTIEFLSYRFEVEIRLDILLKEWDEKDKEKDDKDKAFISGLNARDNFKNWVIVGLAFLFMMTIATHHLGENPVLIFLRRFVIVLGKVLRTSEQGEVDAVSFHDGDTLPEAKWRHGEDVEKSKRDHLKRERRAEKKIVRINGATDRRIERIDQSRKARIQVLEERIGQEGDSAKTLGKEADALLVPEREMIERVFVKQEIIEREEKKDGSD